MPSNYCLVSSACRNACSSISLQRKRGSSTTFVHFLVPYGVLRFQTFKFGTEITESYIMQYRKFGFFFTELKRYTGTLYRNEMMLDAVQENSKKKLSWFFPLYLSTRADNCMLKIHFCQDEFFRDWNVCQHHLCDNLGIYESLKNSSSSLKTSLIYWCNNDIPPPYTLFKIKKWWVTSDDLFKC